MSDWRSRWDALIASDVGVRDGIGWEFTSKGDGACWSVFRDDGGPFPVFSSIRSDGFRARRDDLDEMTNLAVSDLLTGAGHADDVGWITRNLAEALLLACADVQAWEGEEWALESGPDDEPLLWANQEQGRTPYAWLRIRGRTQDNAVISNYQDDANFGLCFIPTPKPDLPEADVGSLRSRRGVPGMQGPITCVEVTYDTTVEGCSAPGLVTEALLHGQGTTTLLVAGEAYSRTDWRLHDESVVVVCGLATADALDWIPARKPWHSTIHTA